MKLSMSDILIITNDDWREFEASDYACFAGVAAEAQLTDLRIRPLGIGYFSSSPDALDLSDDAKPPHQPARSQRVQKKRG